MFPASRHLRFGRRLALLGLLTARCGIGALLAEDAPPSAPLAARSGPRGATLFTTLPPGRTGVKAFNAYDDPAMWGARYHEFNSGAIGTGVAIGDYDGDGRPDIYVACKTGPNHLFRNLGDFRFEDVTERAGVGGPAGPWKQGVTFADVNNDGRLDLYVCRLGAPNLLFINQGDGTFREEAAGRGLALNDASNMAAFGDYDRDGWLDVYVQTNVLDAAAQPDGQRDHLFHNNGNGTFTEVTRAAGIQGVTKGHSVGWWDFDDDGWPDLYVANDFKEPDQLYHNNHDGTFTDVLSAVVPHTPHFSMGSDGGDIDNDGHLDLFVADMAERSHYEDNRGMAMLRSALPEDLRNPHAAPQYLRNVLLLGTGTSHMLEAAQLTGLDATGWTFCVRLEDLDLDGRLDVYFTNGMAREFNNADLVARSFASGSVAERIAVMKASPVLAQHHLAFRNRGNLEFENASAAWGLDHLGVGFGAAFGDLDGDGDLDLVFASYEGEPTVCRNDTTGAHAVSFALVGTKSNRFGVGASVRITTGNRRQLRQLSLARGYLSTSEPQLFFGLGEATTLDEVVVDWPSGRRQTFHDLPADRRYTITEPVDAPIAPPRPGVTSLFVEKSVAANLSFANTEQPLDEFALQPLLPARLNRPGPALAIADLDGDGEDDLVLGGVGGDAGRLISNLGGGQFLSYGRSTFESTAELPDGPILALPMAGSNGPALLVTKGGTSRPADDALYQPRLWLNDGRGRFQPAPDGTLPALPISVGAAAAADFTHSGTLGIFIGGRTVPSRYPETPRSALLAWRDSRWTDVTAEFAPELAHVGLVTAALWCDVDDDGWPDLLVACDWGAIRCFRNVGGRKFEDATTKLGFAAAGTGWWRSLAAADFNGDGRPDIVAGNLGLNTRYHATADKPALLYAGVRVDGGEPRLIEAQAEGDRWYPLRPRDVLLRTIPALGRRFRTAESFARASFGDIFPPALTAGVPRLAATELRSGIFLSQPDGTYRFTPLPRLAQIAPVHGIVAGDLDGDGRADLALVGNSFAPPPETGRFDGGVGWILLGDGQGGFAPLRPCDSGLVVSGDARALARLDLNGDGWPDLVATRSNDAMLAFFNRGWPGRGSFGIQLRGSAGNPTAIGARLWLRLADGSQQCADVSAGSGYFAQSSATTFFGYPQAARPVSLRVRWPDGSESSLGLPENPPPLLRLDHP